MTPSSMDGDENHLQVEDVNVRLGGPSLYILVAVRSSSAHRRIKMGTEKVAPGPAGTK